MDLQLNPISTKLARDYLKKHRVAFSGECDFAIAVCSGELVHGIIAMKANGLECALAHLYTDGTALVGSILYGAAWRAAKALGYKQITL